MSILFERDLYIGQSVVVGMTTLRVIDLDPDQIVLRQTVKGQKRKRKRESFLFVVPAGQAVGILNSQVVYLSSRPCLELKPEADGSLNQISSAPWTLPEDWSSMDLTSDGSRFLYVCHDQQAVAAVFDMATGRMVRVEPTPAPLTRMQLDPETGEVFGIQNNPPVLWRFDQAFELTRSSRVELSPEKDAYFACLAVSSTLVYCWQSESLCGLVRGSPGGWRCFEKGTLLSCREEPSQENGEGCFERGFAWCGAESDDSLMFFTQLTDCLHVPQEIQNAWVTSSAVTPTCQLFCDEQRNTVISCSRNTFQKWRRENLPGKPVGIATVGDRAFVLLESDQPLRIMEVTELVTRPNLSQL